MTLSDLGLIAAPFAAGLLVLATHVPLGIEVLRRGIIFLDLAVAQMAALGVLVAQLVGWDAPELAYGLGVQAAAALAAVLGALLLTWCEKRWPQLQEALIGLMFVVAASVGILLLSGNPHGGEHLRDLLSGQILWVGWERLWPVVLLYAGLLSFWLFSHQRPGRVGFYLIFALAVTASVQLIGVFLVFASLIAPAVASAGIRKHRLPLAGLLGAAGYALGLALSLAFDLPAGAAIVCCLGLIVIAMLLLGPGMEKAGPA